jgi:hypothetical protein
MAGLADPITEEIVTHLRERIHIMIAEDPMFAEAVMPQVNGSWKAAELLDMYINRAFARAFILEM